MHIRTASRQSTAIPTEIMRLRRFRVPDTPWCRSAIRPLSTIAVAPRRWARRWRPPSCAPPALPRAAARHRTRQAEDRTPSRTARRLSGRATAASPHGTGASPGPASQHSPARVSRPPGPFVRTATSGAIIEKVIRGSQALESRHSRQQLLRQKNGSSRSSDWRTSKEYPNFSIAPETTSGNHNGAKGDMVTSLIRAIRSQVSVFPFTGSSCSFCRVTLTSHSWLSDRRLQKIRSFCIVAKRVSEIQVMDPTNNCTGISCGGLPKLTYGRSDRNSRRWRRTVEPPKSFRLYVISMPTAD